MSIRARQLPSVLLAVALSLAACVGASLPASVPDAGAGIVAFDPTPPHGAATWERPTWNVGDRIVLIRGGRSRVELEVAAAGEEGYTLRDPQGRLLRRDRDLGNIGEWPGEGQDGRTFLPVDSRYHWPLWVGKRWRCQFVDRDPSGFAVLIEAGYEVEGMDRISTPAGTFDALRIVRTARVKSDGNWLDRTLFVWYAPAIGLEVRQTMGETALELVEWHGARPGQ